MSNWIILSWVGVAAMSAVNVFLFMKLKGASEQMLKMAFPNAKSMTEAMGEMQKMMGGRMPSGFGGMAGMGGMSNVNVGGLGNLGKAPAKGSDAELKKAMALLQKKNKK